LGLLDLSVEFGLLLGRQAARRDVVDHAFQHLRPLGGITDGTATFPDPFDGAIRRDEAVFERVVLAALDGGGDRVPDGLAVSGWIRS
jgi:hypothetical protein